MKRFIALFFVAMAGGAVALGLYKLTERNEVRLTAPEMQVPVREAAYMPGSGTALPDFEEAASKSIHAVVHIKTEFQRKSSVYDDFFNLFNFGQPYQNPGYSPYTAMGSGVIISADGYIVTNNHVVQEADNITVTLNDKRAYKASIIGTDPNTDLAVIKIDEGNLPYLQYANSDDVRIGEWVLAVGNPFNLTSTVTAGIVSAKARDINILGTQSSIESFIQTDAAVNPGNSGGALVNINGDLIGINAAIASGTGNYVGYSFAIPANIVRKVATDLTRYGKIQRAYLGLSYQEIDDKFAKENGLKSIQGVYIQSVKQGGAAEQAGIRKGDVLIRIQNTPVNSKSQMSEVIGQHSPGDKVMVTVLRDEKEIEMPITLLNENESLAVMKDDKIIIHGATFEPVGEAEKSRFRIDEGYKITKLENGLLRNAGIREGFIVTSIDKQPVHSTTDLKEALTSKKGGILIEGIYPSGMRAYYGIGL